MKTIIIFILLMIVSTAGLFWYQYEKFHDGLLHVVFCDVGQGDAVFIRTPDGHAVLYDGGPDQAVLNCLRDYMPFWDRSIELMLLSHPHADHLIGLMAVLKRYQVRSFETEALRNETAMYTALIDLLKKQGTRMRFVLSGDRFVTSDGVVFRILSPDTAYLNETSPGGVIGEKKEFASLIVQVTYKEFDVLLTGDSQKEAFLRKEFRGEPVDVLQVPHHGSRTGLDERVLSRIRPRLAVISVGKNTYGHPSQEIVDLLGKAGVKAARTDKNGNIEVVSDGETWWVR